MSFRTLRHYRSVCGCPLVLEHLQTAAEYEKGAKYIRGVAAECGVTLAS